LDYSNQIISPGGIAGSINNFFVIAYYWMYSYNIILQYKEQNYTEPITITYETTFNDSSQTAAYEVQAHYLFVNDAGTELSVLRKGIDNDNWSIEFIKMTN